MSGPNSPKNEDLPILISGARLLSQTGFPVFAFRIHQFFSRGETVYASLEPPEERFITTQLQQFVPGDRSKVLLPLAFCRECVDPSRPEDCVIWEGFRVVAVVFATGAVLTCNTAPEPPAADVVVEDEAVEDAA